MSQLDGVHRAPPPPDRVLLAAHVVLAVTHRFDDSLIETVVAKNVNPIEKLERSALLVAETVQALPAPSLVRPELYDVRGADAAAAAGVSARRRDERRSLRCWWVGRRGVHRGRR